MKRRKLLFLIRKHSCFLNHTNIIYVAIFIPVLPVAIMCSSFHPPPLHEKSLEDQRVNWTFHLDLGIKMGSGFLWGTVIYCYRRCCHSTAIFPLPTGKTILH